MSGIYCLLVAIYILIMAEIIKNNAHIALFVKGLLIIISFIILLISIPIHILF